MKWKHKEPMAGKNIKHPFRKELQYMDCASDNIYDPDSSG